MDIENITNEELAAAAQDGNMEVMPLLWEKNEKLIKLIMFRNLRGRKLPTGTDEEDILQCGYFALLSAVKAYNPGEYKFTTYLNYSVQNAVNEAIHGKSRRKKAYREVSFNQPVGDSESEDIELWDLMKDETAERNIFEDIELSDEQRIVQDALAELDPRRRSVIRRHYFRNMTLKQIAEEDGCTIENVRRYESTGLRKLRCNPAIKALNEETEANRFIKAFDTYHISPEYFNALRAAQRLEIELLQNHNLSYGQRQAQIFLLLYRAEQSYREKEKRG